MNQQSIVIISQASLGLLTIVGSGVVSAVVTHRLNAQKTRQDLLRQKLEELFSSVQSFGSLFVRSMLAIQEAHRRGTTPEEEFGQTQTDTSPLSKCQMLVALYFPDITPAFSQWMQVHKKTVELLKVDLSDLHEALRLFIKEQKNLEAVISKQARSLLKS
jgi:hypothetical protein